MWANPCPSAHLMAVLEPDAFESARRLPLVASVAGLTWLARIALDRAFGVGLRTADWLAAWPALVRALDGIASWHPHADGDQVPHPAARYQRRRPEQAADGGPARAPRGARPCE